MLETVFLMCALTFTAPYYDCDDQWAVFVYDEPVVPCPVEYRVNGCALFRKDGRSLEVIRIGNAEQDGCYDGDCKSILRHELLHLMCKCNWHAHLQPQSTIIIGPIELKPMTQNKNFTISVKISR